MNEKVKIELDGSCGICKMCEMQAITKEIVVIDSVETGRLVREKRLEAGMTLAQVAERTGIHISYLSDLETARRDWTPEKFEAVKKAIEGDGKAVAA